jgi:phospholipid/cholesterol/gamma-HCH transport system permease protein
MTLVGAQLEFLTADAALTRDAVNAKIVRLSGSWTLTGSAGNLVDLRQRLQSAATQGGLLWDCSRIRQLDSAGAVLLWQAWNRSLPPGLTASPDHLRVFERLQAMDLQPQLSPPVSPWRGVMLIGHHALGLVNHLQYFVMLLGQLALDTLHVIRHPGDLPRKEIGANLFKSGIVAMPVTALVGFLIGVVLSYLSALQLQQLGADAFIVNILGLGIVRELGPVLVAVLVAGRSGSAMTAQLGVMRVTEEIDALATMGVSRSLRLVFPKVVALAIAMPLLVFWTTSLALVGGMVSAQLQLDMAYGFFFTTLPRVVPVANLWIGLAKGVVFGSVIALVACHFGLRVRPNTESLSSNTTASVVTAITLVIFVDAIFAVATRGIGLPKL